MNCLLCFEYNDNYIDFGSDEAKEYKIGSVLVKHFHFVFQTEPKDGRICRKCWCKVELFHNFYIYIEEIHTAQLPSTIVIENLVDNFKEDVANNSFDEIHDAACEPFSNDDSQSMGMTDDDHHSDNTSKSSKGSVTKLNEYDEDEEHKSSKESKYQCKFCDNRAESKAEYNIHLRKNHLEDVLACPDCPNVFHTQRNLNRHRRNIHNQKRKVKEQPFKTWECNVCKNYFLSEDHLTKHQKSTHFALRFKCRHHKCCESFTTLELLKEHQDKEHSKIKCPICGKSVNSKYMEIHHDRMHVGGNESICKECGKICSDRHRLKAHVMNDHGSQLQCDICSFYFKNKGNILRHMRLMHIKEPTNCHICEKTMPNPTALSKHLSRHNKKENTENVICEVCGRSFSTVRTLQDHIQRVHEEHEPMQCHICKKFYKRRDTLKCHINYAHVQGPRTCPICSRQSPNLKALRKHLRIHKDSLKDRFKCVICGKGFRDRSKLREHSYIHSGKTDAYACNFCDKKFRFGSSWSAHRKKYHAEEMAMITNAGMKVPSIVNFDSNDPI